MPMLKGTNLVGISDAQWQWCLERYNEGYSIAQIAKLCYVSKATVRRKLDAMGARLDRHLLLDPLEERRAEFEALK